MSQSLSNGPTVNMYFDNTLDEIPLFKINWGRTDNLDEFIENITNFKPRGGTNIQKPFNRQTKDKRREAKTITERLKSFDHEVDTFFKGNCEIQPHRMKVNFLIFDFSKAESQIHRWQEMEYGEKK